MAPSVQTLDLRLTLKNVGEYEKFGVSVTGVDDNSTVLTRSNLTAAGNGSNKALILKIPAGALKRADYQVLLTGVTKSGQSETITKYYFSVDK